MTAGAWRGIALLGALPLAAAVQKKPHNIATFILPDGQVLLDGDTYATVVASDGSEHAELEQRAHRGYAQRAAGQAGGDPVPDPMANASANDFIPAEGGEEAGKEAGGSLTNHSVPAIVGATSLGHPGGDELTPEESRGCEDTEGWVNGFTGPAPSLADYWLEAEAEIEAAGHKGVMLWINGKGNTCAAYVFMGVCVNMKWVDESEPDWPCMMDEKMAGREWNHPEENCCACGKAHMSKGAVCSNETQIKVWKNAHDMLNTVGDAFEGTVEERREHDLHAGEGLGATLSLLALSAML